MTFVGQGHSHRRFGPHIPSIPGNNKAIQTYNLYMCIYILKTFTIGGFNCMGQYYAHGPLGPSRAIPFSAGRLGTQSP